MSTNKIPGFFIVGAPKSGTTSLYFYLKQLPEIFLPRIKELNYFCTDLHFRFPLLTEEQFFGYYDGWKNEKIAGEISVWNLFSRAAPGNIYKLNPDSKIIILLRNPVEMMVALHSNHVFNDNEIILDFEDAVKAEEDRKKGNLISPTIKCPVEGLYYTEVASYFVQVKRYIDVFGKENVKIILFEEFKKDVTTAYKEVIKFLEITSDFNPDFKVYNSRKISRSKLLKRLIVAPPALIKSLGAIFFPHQTKRRDWLMYWLWKVNTKNKEPEQIDSAFKRKLMLKLMPDIKNLERLVERNLTEWYR
ncbi:MAG: sulfotransferase domain-containing protein [Chitinophagales bacterium]|nr:sulfotransferase domain-containing protein [Chitinophagales bacterium]